MSPINLLHNPFCPPNRICNGAHRGRNPCSAVVLRQLPSREGAPVHCLGGEVRISVASHYVAIPSFRIRVSLLHEGHSTKAVHQSSGEILIRQIAFESHTFLTIGIEQEHSRLCLAKTLSVPEINSLRNFLNRKICYDYDPCSTFRGYV
jgi:hypothetical protein